MLMRKEYINSEINVDINGYKIDINKIKCPICGNYMETVEHEQMEEEDMGTDYISMYHIPKMSEYDCASSIDRMCHNTNTPWGVSLRCGHCYSILKVKVNNIISREYLEERRYR